MKTIQPGAVLLYYDGARIFEGRDAIGGHYIAMMIDRVDNGVFRYVATGAKPERLLQFRAGELTLRKLFLDAPGGEWFFIDGDPLYGEPLTLEPQKGEIAEQDDLLPGPNFRMRDAPFDDPARIRARESNNTVFEFSVEPLETAYGHRVRAAALGEILTQTQIVVKHAYRSAIRDLSKSDIGAKDGYLMDVVVPAAPGSFRVILEAAAPHGEPPSHPALEPGDLTLGLKRMDEVFQSAEHPDKAREILTAHKGELADAYIKLLGILAEKNTGFHYSWADPHIPGSRYGGVSAAVAKRLYETLSKSGAATEKHTPNA